jgi:hypothetical protein
LVIIIGHNYYRRDCNEKGGTAQLSNMRSSGSEILRFGEYQVQGTSGTEILRFREPQERRYSRNTSTHCGSN